MKAILTILTLTALTFFAGAAAAQTADGSTPAVEDVCDIPELSGGAWGLCNAYCEAMDCHCFLDDTCVPNASQNACDKVKERYTAKAGSVPLPCEQALCPCADPEQWADQTWTAIVTEDLGYVHSGCSENLVTTSNLGFDQFASVEIDAANDLGSCSYGDGLDGNQVSNSFPLTADEASACAALLPACS